MEPEADSTAFFPALDVGGRSRRNTFPGDQACKQEPSHVCVSFHRVRFTAVVVYMRRIQQNNRKIHETGDDVNGIVPVDGILTSGCCWNSPAYMHVMVSCAVCRAWKGVKLLKWPHITQIEHVAKLQQFLQGYISPATLRLAKSIGYALWLVHAAACTFHYVRSSS